jgi:hypothetical protein
VNRQSLTILFLGLGLIGLTAALLGYAQTHQQLGNPGLRLVSGELYDDKGNLAANTIIDLPAHVPGFESQPLPVTRDELDWLPADTTFGYRRYIGPDSRWLDLRVVMMGTDRTSIHKPEYCLPGQGFQIQQTQQDLIRIPEPHPYDLPVTRIIASRTIRATPDSPPQEFRAVFVYWFVAEDRITADHLERMWWMARDLVRTGTLQRWAYVSCLAFCLPGEEEATYQRIEQFLIRSVPRFQITTRPPVAEGLAHASILNWQMGG